MITEDQTAVISFLASPSAHGGAPVERIDTHASIVFLAGQRAYKLKRAVRFDYLDFSTVERRRTMCEAEVALNRRTAPTVYRRVVAVSRRADGTLSIEGNGTPVDWVVEMNRFPQEALLDRLAASGQLDLDLMPALAKAVADFHLGARPRRDHGGAAGLSWVIDGNATGLVEFGTGLDRETCDRLARDARRELERRGALLDARRDAGYVRECHGDLHLRNIVLLDGRPTVFDGVEFNDNISCTDVYYDLAFLLMDLWRRSLPRHANTVWNRYLAETGDFGGMPALPLFLSCRAAVRAKTSATAAATEDRAQRQLELRGLAREYLEMAEQLLGPPKPALIAVGGLSGSGKSALARELAPRVGAVPGAVVLRSDEIRKRLYGVPRLDHLPPDAYAPEVSQRVYATALEHARLAVRNGHSAIVDAVFARPEDRQAVEALADENSTPFVGLWLEAPEAILIDRVTRRGADFSDADASVVRAQIAQGIGHVGWRRMDGSLPAASVLSDAADHLRERVPEALAAAHPAAGRAR